MRASAGLTKTTGKLGGVSCGGSVSWAVFYSLGVRCRTNVCFFGVMGVIESNALDYWRAFDWAEKLSFCQLTWRDLM